MARPRPRGRGYDMGPRIGRAFGEYDNFAGSNDDDPDRAKRFYARHNALKACVNHAQALRQFEGSPSTDTPENSGAMLALARAALAQENILDEPEAEY